MKFRNDSFLLKIIIGMLVMWLLLSMAGCASWTEEYWEERYANMTPEEIAKAKAGGGELVQLCDLTDCIFVWIY